jgi:arabinofuranan 3-O-arabinosyltransferase
MISAAARRRWPVCAALLAAIAYVPLLFTHPGMVGADTKAYLTIDPGRLLAGASSLWDPNTGLGTVTHQNIGYLVPMGPWYWTFHAVGVPMWVAQRLWIGTLLFAAGSGVIFLLATLGGTVGWEALAGGALYELTPYVVEYEARISAILMPWSALPWLLALTVRAVRRGGWKDPALFALVATVVGGVNATALILVGIAPVLWIAFAVGLGETGWIRAIGVALRIGALTLVTALWWIAGLSIEAGYGLNVLRYTETVQTVATSGTAVEVLRGLGDWYVYGGDSIAAWVQPAIDFTQWGWLLAVSLAVPVVAFVSAVILRWREKAYFVALIVIGVALGVGVHPYQDPSPLGALFKRFANGSTAGLALRSTGRAVPLVALGLAVLVAAATRAVLDRRPRAGALLSVGLTVLAIANMTPLFIGQFVDNQLQRPENLPAYWTAAARYLDSQSRTPAGYSTRVLEEPGEDFLHYRWGATLDPITPGLINRPYADRELVPQGGAASADLLRAFDERLQEGWLEPSAIAPLARRLAVGDLVLRSDLQWERYHTPRPEETWALFDPPPAGLGQPVAFGPEISDLPAVVPYEDEQELALSPTAAKPPAVAVYGVDDPEPLVRTEPASDPIIMAGDGEGMVDAAAAGLLSGDQPVRYSGTLDATPGGVDAALTPGAALVLTDTNRRRAQRYGSIRDTFGYTEEAGEKPLVPDPNDARLPVFPGVGDDAYTVARESGDGVAEVQASAYGGSTFTYDQQSRPDLAVDGNPSTAWIVGSFSNPLGQYLRIDLSKPTTTGSINLQQPYIGHPTAPPGQKRPSGPANLPDQRWITRVRLHFDRGPDLVENLGSAARSAGGETLRFPQRTFDWVEITITKLNVAPTDPTAQNGVGFSEVRIGNPAPKVDEVLRLPTDLLSAVGAANISHRLTILMTRLQTNPAEPYTGDPEPGLARTFTLPTGRTFSLGATARISALAPDYKLDPLLGVPNSKGMLIADSSGRLPGDLAARAYSAVDGNPATAWMPARGDQVGQWIRIDLPHPVSLAHLDLQIVADGRHSVPTSIGVEVDGGATHVVAIPPIRDRSAPNSTVSVPISLPGVTALHDVVFTIDAVRKVTTLDNLSHQQVTEPVGIAELGLPGIKEATPQPTVPSYCRSDLLTIDGKPISVRLVGSTAAAAARQDLTVQPCGKPLYLGPGPHVVRSTPGQDTAIDINRVILSSAPGGEPDPTLGRADATGGSAAPAVTVLSQTRTSARVRVAAGPGGPAWLVLAQSLNKGWTARVDGAGSLGAPTLVDGFANGWLVNLPAGRAVTVDLSWTPQRRVDLALLVSILGVLLCAALVVAGRRRPLARGSSVAVLTAPWAPVEPVAGLVSVALVAGTGVTAFLLTGPLLAAISVAAVAASLVWRRGRVLLAVGAVGCVAAAGAVETAGQLIHHYPLILAWSQHFEGAGRLAWLGVLLLGAEAVTGGVRSRACGRSTEP